jgi:fatty acid desaturase
MRYAADYKTILWLAIATAIAATSWFVPHLRGYLLPFGCYFALCAGIIAHNHNHSPTFKNRTANELLNNWATVFYGFAAFNWIPTHNNNHHKFQNAPGDATITWRWSNRHNLFTMLPYPFVSMVYQVPLIDAFVKNAKKRNPAYYRTLIIQLLVCWVLPIALTLVNWRAAVWAIWIPRGFSLYAIIWLNYVQHVHCDPYDKWNHSRNFTSRWANWFLFNNGFHTVHHITPGMHWSLSADAHFEIEKNIHPELNQKSLWWWVTKSYFLGLVFDRFATHQIGRAPMNGPAEPAEEAIAEVA